MINNKYELEERVLIALEDAKEILLARKKDQIYLGVDIAITVIRTEMEKMKKRDAQKVEEVIEQETSSPE